MTTEEQILGLVAMLGSRIGDLEARMRDLQQQMAARRAGDRHHYAGAFRGEITDGGDKLYVREGRIWAGTEAYGKWPDDFLATTDDFIPVTHSTVNGGGEGQYGVFLYTSVNISDGTFQFSPPDPYCRLEIVNSNDFATLQTGSLIAVLIGMVKVISVNNAKKFCEWQQRQHCDLLLPVRHILTSGDYSESLEIGVYPS
jgi:hypothetical protein